MTRQPEPTSELLTPAAVAAILFVDPKTVTRWATAGKISAIRTPGGHRRFLRADVMALLEPPDERVPEQGASRPEPVGAVIADAVRAALEAEASAATEAMREAVSALVAAAARADAALTHVREMEVLATRGDT